MNLSIITINLNNAFGLRKTMQSVLSQYSFCDIEYIIVDGGSSDSSLCVIQENVDKIKYISEKDGGIYDAMNKGIKMSSGDYLLFLNSGDVLFDNNVIQDVIPYLDGSNDIVIGHTVSDKTHASSPIGHEITFNTLYSGYVPHPSSFIMRNVMMRHLYDTNLKISSDWKFFIEALIIDNCSYKWIDRNITLFDTTGISNTNISLTIAEKEQVINEILPRRIIRDYENFNNGFGYENTIYDKFFIELRDYKSSKIIYTLSVCILKILSYFKLVSRFVRRYPIRC